MRRGNILIAVLSLALAVVVLKEQYVQRAWQWANPPVPAQEQPFYRHPAFLEQEPLQRSYHTPGVRIIMLGTSYTYRVAWNELLGRCDVINRGVPSDVTAGLVARGLPLFRQYPELRICFIEGGGNDLPRGVLLGKIISNLKILVDSARVRGIHPVLTTTPLCSADQPRWSVANPGIERLNAAVRIAASKWNVPLLDLSRALSGDAEILPQPFATRSDGVHLTYKSYAIWKSLVEAQIRQTADR